MRFESTADVPAREDLEWQLDCDIVEYEEEEV